MPTPGMLVAMDSLQRGAAFVAGSRRAGAAALPDRVVVNILGELDRFLHVLLDEVNLASGRSVRASIHHSAVKLNLVTGASARTGTHLRLRALGKTRLCLRDEDGVVRYPDIRGGTVMTLGWSAHGPVPHRLRQETVGASARPIGDDLADVARFYARTGDAILARARRGVPRAGEHG